MIKPVSNAELPKITRRNETAYDLEEFMQSTDRAAEVIIREGTADKIRARYYQTIKRCKLPVKTAVRGNRLFLIKGE
ncbi:MAG: hypothetical protein IKV50_09200 [Clostridia bacterium]|nr:hypothetical protein [Clostridia bacterium]MBR5264853.1 hypothetical protein [Clostridia bacterium]